MVLTPHVRASDLTMDPEDALEQREVAFDPLRSRAPSSPRLHLGFEIMLDQPLSAAVTGDRRFSLAESRYYLVEFYLPVAPESVLAAVQQMARAGVVPVVAHPERYLRSSVRTVAAWRAAGAKVQVDATGLTRSTQRGRRARQLVVAGLADVVAADNHGDRSGVNTAVQFLEQHGFPEAAHRLSTENPQAIVEDRVLVDVPPVPLPEDMWSRMKNIMGV